jgi:hypothetical protein
MPACGKTERRHKKAPRNGELPKMTITVGISNPAQVVASILHTVKSISCLQPLHTWVLSNSSEKISASLPQLGHLQEKEVRVLWASNPGQCIGVLIIISFFGDGVYGLRIIRS